MYIIIYKYQDKLVINYDFIFKMWVIIVDQVFKIETKKQI